MKLREKAETYVTWLFERDCDKETAILELVKLLKEVSHERK